MRNVRHPIRRAARALAPAVVLLLLYAGLIGCTEELTPRDHFEQPFSVFGVLSPDLDTQSVRVYPLENFPTLGTAEALEDIVVTSTDRETGEHRTWQGSVVVEENGQHEFLFEAPFRAAYDRRYLVEVQRRSDGARSFAEVRIPPRATVRIAGEARGKLDVRIEGDGIQALTPEVEYFVRAVNFEVEPGILIPIAYRLAYKRQQVEGGGQVKIDMVADRWRLQGLYYADTHAMLGVRCRALAVLDMSIHALVGDSVWNPPDGVFDPNVLARPGTLQNVQNGFGFIGGGYRIHEQLRPSREVVEEACLYYTW